MNTYKENVAFAMMRIQPLHKGHYNLITKMIAENDIVIIGLGSSQISDTFDNPFSVSDRINMLKTLFGQGAIGKHGKIKVVAIEDIGAVEPDTWVSHCFSKIIAKDLPLPNNYYAGSDMDAAWYRGYDVLNKNKDENRDFNDVELNINILDRKTVSINSSATEIRKSIANNFTEWKQDVPLCLHNYILDNFPTKFMLNYNIKSKA